MKTRLVRNAIDERIVAELYRRFVSDTLEMLNTCSERTVIFFHPESAEQRMREWLGDRYDYCPQQGNDIGDKMAHAFRWGFRRGFDRILLMGTDIPDLPASFIREGFRKLSDCGAVIVPARDGGYCLIGFSARTFTETVFKNIRWSTETVFKETINILKKRNISIHLLPVWRDIDDIYDLADFAERSLHRGRDSRTYDYLKHLGWTGRSFLL